MRRKPFAVLRHAATMVGRTLKSYALLSVTIVLSFSLLLGYFVYTDSTLYNQYKGVFALDRSFVGVSLFDHQAAASSFQEKAEAIGNTHVMYVQRFSPQLSYSYYDPATGSYVSPATVWTVAVLPEHAWAVYADFGEVIYPRRQIQWLDGQEHSGVDLKPGEAIMSESMFHLLKLDEMEEPTYTISWSSYNTRGNSPTSTVRIVGLTEDLFVMGSGLPDRPDLFISAGSVPAQVEGSSLTGYPSLIVYSDSPEQIAQLCEQMGLTYYTVFVQQNMALESKREATDTKAIITAALLLLLGINLYSSFRNALNDRKYEIGVKRAVGASAGSIVRQFFYESVMVMAANIVLSVVAVVDVALVYKLIVQQAPNVYGEFEPFILYITPYSAGMFAVCSVTLTVVFSLIFAYQSTRVEIVQYLKAE